MYTKVAMMFPGQGSQFSGMGMELYRDFASIRSMFYQASEIVGYDLADLCFRKIGHSGELLKKTEFTQTALFVTDLAAYKALEERCSSSNTPLKPYVLMGHSLGEYPALVAGGSMSFENALRLVQKRAEYMGKESRHYPQAKLMAMRNKKGLDPQVIADIAKKHSVYLALINTDSQIVLGGPLEQMQALKPVLEGTFPGSKFFNIDVEGPFHTPIIRPAADRLNVDIKAAEINIASIPLIANVTALAISDPVHIRDELYRQVYHPVNWRDCVNNAARNGADLFIELGPKKVLSNMVNSMHPDIAVFSVEDAKTLEDTVRGLTNGK